PLGHPPPHRQAPHPRSPRQGQRHLCWWNRLSRLEDRPPLRAARHDPRVATPLADPRRAHLAPPSHREGRDPLADTKTPPVARPAEHFTSSIGSGEADGNPPVAAHGPADHPETADEH